MIYVVSDIHGHYNHFIELIKKIKLSEKDTLYILGDIIDRGPENIKLIDKVMSMFNVKMILGNHEDMMLIYQASKNFWNKHLWYENGGNFTDAEFKILDKEHQDKIIDYFSSLPIELEVTVNNKVYQLVHGSYVPEMEMKSMTKLKYSDNILWGRIDRFDAGPKDKVVIFGHTCTAKYTGSRIDKYKIWKKDNLIGIDCGMAGYSLYPNKCQLGCLCLDTMEEIYV